MSETVNITIAVPHNLVDDANQLARCVGYGPEDDRTFQGNTWQDVDGNLYAVASGPVWPAFMENALAPLVEPQWGADLTAATRAQMNLVVFDLRIPETEVTPANHTLINAVVGVEGLYALSLLGIAAVPELTSE
jgi:hypothetical protein